MSGSATGNDHQLHAVHVYCAPHCTQYTLPLHYRQYSPNFVAPPARSKLPGPELLRIESGRMVCQQSVTMSIFDPDVVLLTDD